jgi:hypothetical protein
VQNVKPNGEVLLGRNEDNCGPRTNLNYGTGKKIYGQRRIEYIYIYI